MKNPRSFIHAGAFVSGFALALASGASGDIVFVDASSGSAVQNGASWATPFHTLGPALSAASGGDQIWVAKGTYKPTATTNQTISFVLKTNVDLFGGFENGDNTLDDADPVANATTLSGEIGLSFINTDNSQHVIRGTSVTGVNIDGFSIVEGYADGAGGEANGGGALLSDSSVRFQRCRFGANHAEQSGGAVHAQDSSLFLVECALVDNDCDVAGGAVNLALNSLGHINSCRLLGNHAQDGGAVRCESNCTVNLVNAALSGNVATNNGGAANISGQLTVRNCSIAGNASAVGADGVMLSTSASGTLSNCAFGGNGNQDVKNDSASVTVTFTSVSNGAASPGAGNILADPKFRDADGADGVFGTDDDNLRLRGDSPCIDRGNTSALPTDLFDLDGDLNLVELLPFDLDGTPRRKDDLLVPNLGAGAVPMPDMGAYENDRPTTWFVNHAAVGANNGFTWTDAFTKLEDALAAQGDVKFGGPAEIWVAKGTYKPTTTTDRTKTFNVFNNAKVFGGFNGGELERSARDPWLNTTVLSGDIGAATQADNSLHVVTFGQFDTPSTVLDGFVVTRGEATINSGDSNKGAGIKLQNGATPIVQNCRIIGNHASSFGGGVHNVDSGVGPLIINCVIAHNSGAAGGGLALGSGTLFNCTCVDNTSALSPAGLAILGGASAVTIANSIFSGNAGNAGDEADQLNGSTALLFTHSLVQCYTGLVPGTSISGDRPLFVDPDGADDVAGTPDDDYHVIPGSPTIDAGTANFLAGDPCDIDGDGITAESTCYDIDLGLRAVNDTGMPNSGIGSPTPDIGADEFAGTTISIPNPADINGDGFVNGADIAFVLGNWNTSGPLGDVNADCIVDGQDIALVLGSWTG